MEDFATITGRIIPSLLVTQLKGLIKTLNETIRPSPQLRIGGNKADLIQRLVQLITEYHNIGDQVVIRQIRHCVAAYSQGDVSTIATPSVPLHQPYTANTTSSSSSSAGTSTSGSYRTQPSSSSSMLTSKPMPGHSPHHAPYGAGISHRNPHHPAHPVPTTASYRTGMLHNQAQQVFKSSPFYKDIQIISQPRLCVEAKDRTVSVLLPLTIPPMLSMQLKKDPEFQVMVFCGWADGPSSSQTLMEFPHVCEIKVNGRVLEANLRGMKNKPGTVSPANITKLCKLEPADYNKVEFIYANSTKRYYASMHLVKKISVESIVAEIERGKFLSKEKMLRMIEDRNKDDDIMATSSTLSLKCPLGFQRITVPCRSSYCQHLQCFDAYTFFNLNEQTPTWTCPVCSRIMHSWEEIVVDGYFKDILKLTPKSLENITVQADGSWELPSVTPPLDQPVAPSPKKQKSTPAGGESVFVIDEDESEDEESTTPSPAGKSTKPTVEVIDLISDSEDEADEGSLPPKAVTDEDGDTSMQEAANSLQSMATATGDAGPRSVKTEDLEKSVPVDGIAEEAPPPLTSAGAAPTTGGTAIAVAAPEIHSIVGSASGSPPTAASSASPEISSRMAQTDPNQTGVRSPTSRVPQTVWRESNEDMFMNALLNPRRKRQFDDTVDTESINAMSYDARQRIARLDIHSNGSSDRGSSSTIPSPDAVRRSTSSPTPVPSFHELDRRGYYENGHPMSVAPPMHGTFASQHPPHHQSHTSQGTSQRGDSRGATMSPPLHPGYSSASPHHPHHHSHPSQHHPQHRSANSPGPEYYSGLSRPSSTGSLSAMVSMAHRPSSIPVSSLSRTASSSSSSMTAMPSYGSSSTNSGWSPNEWRGDLRYIRSSSNQATHGDSSPRRISTDEAGSSLGHQASFTKYPPSQQHSPSPYHQSHSSYSQSTPQHQRHYSNDDSSFYAQRDGHPSNSNGNGNGSGSGTFHRVDYINNSDEGRGSSSSYHHDHGSHSQHAQQHVYSSNHGSRSSSYSSSVANGHEGGAGVSEDRRRSESSKDEEAPIFSYGIRGARAR